ncbi:MAG TPA: hypothetical protein VFP47_14630 [Pyrinomonadaceae bacterium]|nr:hypothetical protein [Pyrinomonadaceae bacterium]
MSDTDLVGAGEYQGELIEVKKYSSLRSGRLPGKNKSGRGACLRSLK